MGAALAAVASAALPAAGEASARTSSRVRHSVPEPMKTMTGQSVRSRPDPERLRGAMQRYVDAGELAGAVALLSGGGQLAVAAVGTLAPGSPPPMGPDSIFRIASLTKPVTAAAAMVLVEDGVLGLDEPVDRWLPELADRRVLREPAAPLDDTVPASRPISVRDLLTLRLGIGAVLAPPGSLPIQSAMERAGVAPGPELPDVEADELMRRFGSLPLLHHPGEGWLYHSGSDILGVLVARAAGTTLGGFLRERILEPLGMRDTGFSVAAESLGRFTDLYRRDADGSLVVLDEARAGRFARPPRFEAAGGGLVSTAHDYLAFLRMMMAGGVSGDGRRILSRDAVTLMTQDHLTAEQRAANRIFFGEDRGWGFGMAVYHRGTAPWAVAGRFGWDGGYGTSAYADPRNDVVGVLLTQRMMDSPEPPPVFRDFWSLAYAGTDA